MRDSQSDGVAANIQEASPAGRTCFSVQDEFASVSVSYEPADQATSSPSKLTGNRGRGSATHEPGQKTRGKEFSVSSNPPRPRKRPEKTRPNQSNVKTTHGRVLFPSRKTNASGRAQDSLIEGARPRKAAPRRVKTVFVEGKRGSSDGKTTMVRVEFTNVSSPESGSSDPNASNKGIHSTSDFRAGKTAPGRQPPLHQRLKTMCSLKDPLDFKQKKRAGGYEPLGEWRRASSYQDNDRMCCQWQEKPHESTLGQWTANDEKRFDGDHRGIEPDGKEKHAAYQGVSKTRGRCNRQHSENTSVEETEDEARAQQRWRNRGRVLWSTHAEPAASAASHVVRSHSEPATRPYHGLYARSLRANGIDPTNFRASHCGYDAAGLSCATPKQNVDGSLLWRGSRRDDSFAAGRTRAPTDGLPDRLEAGRVLDSFNRRAELLGTLPPTPLRAKAAWMETPGDPEYRYCVLGRNG